MANIEKAMKEDMKKHNQIMRDKGLSDVDALVMCDCYPEHCTHGDTCWCEPQIEIINGNKIIIHNEAN